jgi:hypothetical protein
MPRGIREFIPRHGFDDANRPFAVVLRKPLLSKPSFRANLALPQHRPAAACTGAQAGAFVPPCITACGGQGNITDWRFLRDLAWTLL